ncbi:hypothetical protein BsWGS_12087 [Bradybaena similaris]
MAVKLHFVVLALAAVMWTAWAATVARSARSIQSAHGRSLVKREYPYQYETNPLKTTTEPGGCYYNGNYYKDEDYVEEYPCYSLICLSGEVAVSDKTCETLDGCNVNYPPDDCCPLCETTTTSTTPAPITEPPGCYVDYTFYEYGEYIKSDPCYPIICTEGGIVYGDIFCDTPAEGCNQYQPPNDCCPPCRVITNTTTTTTTTTPAPPVCYYYGNPYQIGDRIPLGTCSYLLCVETGFVYYDVNCDNPTDRCNVYTPPNECCGLCLVYPPIDPPTDPLTDPPTDPPTYPPKYPPKYPPAY